MSFAEVVRSRLPILNLNALQQDVFGPGIPWNVYYINIRDGNYSFSGKYSYQNEPEVEFQLTSCLNFVGVEEIHVSVQYASLEEQSLAIEEWVEEEKKDACEEKTNDEDDEDQWSSSMMHLIKTKFSVDDLHSSSSPPDFLSERLSELSAQLEDTRRHISRNINKDMAIRVCRFMLNNCIKLQEEISKIQTEWPYEVDHSSGSSESDEEPRQEPIRLFFNESDVWTLYNRKKSDLQDQESSKKKTKV